MNRQIFHLVAYSLATVSIVGVWWAAVCGHVVLSAASLVAAAFFVCLVDFIEEMEPA